MLEKVCGEECNLAGGRERRLEGGKSVPRSASACAFCPVSFFFLSPALDFECFTIHSVRRRLKLGKRQRVGEN